MHDALLLVLYGMLGQGIKAQHLQVLVGHTATIALMLQPHMHVHVQSLATYQMVQLFSILAE